MSGGNITIYAGGLGSGKTLMAEREMVLSGKHCYSNIIQRKPSLTPWIHQIKPENIIKKVEIAKKKNGQIIYEYDVNKEFWQDEAIRPCNIVLDEVHTIAGHRNAMSRINKTFNKFISMLRRAVNDPQGGFGKAIFITQLTYGADSVIRDMAAKMHYHICTFVRYCPRCAANGRIVKWKVSSEDPEQPERCNICGNIMLRDINHIVHEFRFKSLAAADMWFFAGKPTNLPRNRAPYYSYVRYRNLGKYMKLYDTLQWDNLFENY